MSRLESDYYAYMGFDPEHARAGLAHYTSYFAGAEPVVELACGRGEFLGLLAASGIGALGVDNDEGMVAAVREAGLQVEYGDAVEYLHKVAPASVGGVFAAHLLEHLEPVAVERLVTGVAEALRPGGVFVAVVPNAACLSVLCHDFWRDPTHVRFYDPALIGFFCSRAGLAVEHVGGNPANTPGPPPGLVAGPVRVDPKLGDVLGQFVQSASNPRGRRRGGDPRSPWYQLGNLLNVLDGRLQLAQEQLGALQRAYDELLRRLYPSNEVYVVARA